MKKLILVSAVALFGTMNAQKGSVLVGGDISLGSQNVKIGTGSLSSEVKTNSFSFNPTIGYQFTDKLTAGVRLGYGSTKDTEQVIFGTTVVDADTKTENFQYGVFGRYTKALSETFAVYGDLDIYGTNGKITVPNTISTSITYSETKTNGYGVKFTPNLFINFKNSFGLNFNIGGLGYETSKVKGADYKTNSFGFDFGKGVTVGISKNFK